jgi:hypothetical protein
MNEFVPEPTEDQTAEQEAKLREIDAACKEYYDNASDDELAEQREWAEMTAPSMFTDIGE